jgi:hypothetical protein
MMHGRDADELRTLRGRVGRLEDAIDRARQDRAEGVARYVGRVFNDGSIPATVPRVFATHPVRFSVAESDGATPTIDVGSASVPVLVLGPRVPVAADVVLAKQVQGRWVAGLPGTAPVGPVVSCLPCDIPASALTLTLTYINQGGTHSTAVIPLSYTPGPPASWESGVATIADYGGFCVALGSYVTQHKFTLTCLPNPLTGDPNSKTIVDHFFNIPDPCGNTYRFVPSSFTCSPYYIDFGGVYTVFGPGGAITPTIPDVDLIVSL